MNQFTVLLLTFLFSLNSIAENQLFSEFDEILKSNVVVENLSGGGVQSSFDYEKAYGNSKTKDLIKAQRDKLSKFKITTLSSKNEATAFWINAYNFYMITVILEQGFKKGKLDINSVKDFGSFFNPYKIFKKEIHLIDGKKVSLDYMEKTVLLGDDYKKKGWKDARIHFAVNCASVGCPPLTNTIYTAKNVDSVLDDNLKKAFKTKRQMQIDGSTLKLTSLFKWYKKDFEEDSGSTKAFIKKYVDEETYKKIQKTSDISFIDYDWNLNKPANFK